MDTKSISYTVYNVCDVINNVSIIQPPDQWSHNQSESKQGNNKYNNNLINKEREGRKNLTPH